MNKIVSSKQNVRKTFAQYTHYTVYIPVFNIRNGNTSANVKEITVNIFRLRLNNYSPQK